MARITGPDLSPHSPQTSAGDPAYVHTMTTRSVMRLRRRESGESMMMRTMKEGEINVIELEYRYTYQIES